MQSESFRLQLLIVASCVLNLGPLTYCEERVVFAVQDILMPECSYFFQPSFT